MVDMYLVMVENGRIIGVTQRRELADEWRLGREGRELVEVPLHT